MWSVLISIYIIVDGFCRIRQLPGEGCFMKKKTQRSAHSHQSILWYEDSSTSAGFPEPLLLLQSSYTDAKTQAKKVTQKRMKCRMCRQYHNSNRELAKARLSPRHYLFAKAEAIYAGITIIFARSYTRTQWRNGSGLQTISSGT